VGARPGITVAALKVLPAKVFAVEEWLAAKNSDGA
jgi:hypothetical protein